MKRPHHSKARIVTTWIIASVIALAMGLSIFLTRPNYDWAALSDASFIPSALLIGQRIRVISHLQKVVIGSVFPGEMNAKDRTKVARKSG